MDVREIKQYLIENPDKIRILLENSDFHNITLNGDEYRAGRDIDTNPTSVRVKMDTLSSTCFSTGVSGDIITLIGAKLNIDFRDTLRFIKGTLGLSKGMVQIKEVKLPFGGYFKKLGKKSKYDSYIEPIPESTLENYIDLPNKMFLDDGISIESQKKFNIMYDPKTNRVAIPHWDLNGNLIGVMGRYNGDTDDFKYIPITKGFSKSKTLYGYWQNYNNIQEKSMVIIGESEKFVMQLDTFGLPIGLGLGGSMLSDTRIAQILALQTDVVILAYDEGLEESFIIENAERLVSDNPFFKSKVGYIYDKDNKYLPKGSKYSPTDLGYDTFKKLLSECVIWVGDV